MRQARIALVALLALAACTSPIESRRVIGPSPSPHVTSAPTPTSEPTAPPTPEPSPPATVLPLPRIDAPEVRFAAVGDIGQGNDTQARVGDGIAAVHATSPLDVLLLPGDIIYPDGAGHRYERNFAQPWRAVLDAGHDHHYERTIPIDGTVHIVAGTACCLRDHGHSDFTAAAMREPGVAVVEADAHSLAIRFVHADGRVLDSATIDLAADEAA